jgi:hypothetical protein
MKRFTTKNKNREFFKNKEKFIYETDNSITRFNCNNIQPNIGLVFYF